MRTRTVFRRLVAPAFLLGISLSASAQGPHPDAIKTEFQYAVKAICSLLGTFGDGFLANGVYRTVINVHNPRDKTIRFARKVALAGEIGTEPSEFSVTAYKAATLGPDGAVAIDCGDIANFYCPTPQGFCVDFTAIDGFVVINSPVELDVVAVYTARGAQTEVQSVEVESIPPRRLSKTIKTVSTAPPIKERIQRQPYRGSIKP